MKVANQFNAGAWTIVRLFLILAVPLTSKPDVQTATQNLTGQIDAIGKLSVTPSLSLTNTGTTFVPYSGTVSVSYRVRTTPSGSGSITLQATSDFSPAGGPSIPAGALTYTCSGASLGVSCSGTRKVTTGSQTPVLTTPGSSCTGGGGACSSANPNTAAVNFVLANNPSFKTGIYSATLTFNISAL